MAGMITRAVASALALLMIGALVACGGSTPLPVPPRPSAPAARSPGAESRAPEALDGTSFYFVQTGDAVQVLSVRSGTLTRRRQIASAADDSCPGNSVVVSPDGQWLAWVTGAHTLGDITGTLSVVRLSGSTVRTVDNVVCSLNESDWTPDGLQVVQSVNQASADLTVDPATGATRPRADPADEIHSANGAFRVRRDGGARNSFVVESAGGAVVRTVRDYANGSAAYRRCGYTLHGISDDGRYVTIGGCSTDPSRVLGANLLYDTRTRRHVTLPVTRPDSIAFVPGGVLTHERGRLVLASMTGRVMLSAAEPSNLPGNARFLVYVRA